MRSVASVIVAGLLVTASSGCAFSGREPVRAPLVRAEASDGFASAFAAAIVDTGVDGPAARRPKVATTTVHFGAGSEPSAWHAEGFAASGVEGTQHLIRHDLPDGGVVFAALLDFDRPESTDACDAPWVSAPFNERPCELTRFADGVDLVEVAFTNIREMYLVGPEVTLGLTTALADVDGRMLPGRIPLSRTEQRDLLLSIARNLAGEKSPV